VNSIQLHGRSLLKVRMMLYSLSLSVSIVQDCEAYQLSILLLGSYPARVGEALHGAKAFSYRIEIDVRIDVRNVARFLQSAITVHWKFMSVSLR
jgi:hypothetical protein